jgi:glycosyltransferase involved in cell wall biosynthesis
MNLLIVTQKVNRNDSILGFFHRWLEEFAKHCEKLTVICLEKGEYDLPDNVRVLSLGKEKNVSRWQYIIRFYKYIWQERRNYDFVFVHMNVEYIILGGLPWKLLRKKIGLWYMHKNVSFKLKLAEKFTGIIFTGTKESFRLKSKKLQILHHGIDNNLFFFKDRTNHEELEFISVGRISKIKNLHLMIDLVKELKKEVAKQIIFSIVGDPVTEKDDEYLKQLKNKIDELNLQANIRFLGAVPNYQMPTIYQKADIFLNFSETGSLDKAILEAMSCGTLVMTSNDSAEAILPEELFFDDVDSVKDKIFDLLQKDNDKLRRELSEIVKKEHSLDELINKILTQIQL